jgi:hypothetical protein
MTASFRLIALCSLAALVAGSAACAKPQAKTSPTLVVLDVPPAPERVIPTAPAAAAEPEPEPEPEPEVTAPARRTATRQPRTRPDQPKVDVPTPPPADAAPTPAATSGPLLRKPQSADTDEAVRRIRAMLDRAARDLSRVNYTALKPDTRAQYDTAKRFIEQAEEALRSKNYDIASYLADKAQTLARELPAS